ncbi:MAG TPA: DinB family protein [Trebonia sp.]|nr:DinB family protein [Trebonia sp.]
MPLIDEGIPPRLTPLLEQFDWACLRLINRMLGPRVDSGNGTPVAVPLMTDDEYRWEPVPGSWSVRRREDGPAPGATALVGAGEWGRDSGHPAPEPPPLTTIAWRLSHISEMLAMRADYTIGSRSLNGDTYVTPGTALAAVAAFRDAVGAWRGALLAASDADLSTTGLSTYPYGSDSADTFIDTIWWVNQEILHHGGEIALLRDLYRATKHISQTDAGPSPAALSSSAPMRALAPYVSRS